MDTILKFLTISAEFELLAGEVLTEAQVVALERKQEDDVACGEIETAHPEYLIK